MLCKTLRTVVAPVVELVDLAGAGLAFCKDFASAAEDDLDVLIIALACSSNDDVDAMLAGEPN